MHQPVVQRLGSATASAPSSGSPWVKQASSGAVSTNFSQTWYGASGQREVAKPGGLGGVDAVLGGTSLDLLVAGREQRAAGADDEGPADGSVCSLVPWWAMHKDTPTL